MSRQTFFVEFSLCDGDDRPDSLSDIEADDTRVQEGLLPHSFSFFFQYSPENKQVIGEYSVEMVWDGITSSHLHKSDGVKAFGVDHNDQSFTGSPSPILGFELLGDVNIEDFINQWDLTCSPCEDYFFEDWRGCKRILSEDELERRGLTGDHPSRPLIVPISEGMRSTEEHFVLEKNIHCQIERIKCDSGEDYSPFAESSGSMDKLPAGWLQDPSYKDVSANYQDFYKQVVDKLITDNAITRRDLIDLASYSIESFAILALFHPLADKVVNDRFLSVHDDGDRDWDGIFQHIDFNRSLPISPWRYSVWLIDGDEGYAEDLLIACDWKLEPELCRLFIEHGKKLDYDDDREVLYNILSKVVNLPEELKGQLESLVDQ
jgi:hypothetical protein